LLQKVSDGKRSLLIIHVYIVVSVYNKSMKSSKLCLKTKA
jgi:hypothetical protein